MLNKITNVSFTGKIIDVHTHTGHWDKPAYGKADGAEPYTIGLPFSSFMQSKFETITLEISSPPSFTRL